VTYRTGTGTTHAANAADAAAPTKLASRRRQLKLIGAPPPPGQKWRRAAAAENWSARTSIQNGTRL